MTPQEILDTASQNVIQFIQQLVPGLPHEVVRYVGAGLFGGVALVLLVLAIKILVSGNRKSSNKRINVPRTLQKDGVVVDILNAPDDDEVAVRCVITSASSGKIKCEIIERQDIIRAKEGAQIACVFAPMQTGQGKVNSFTAKLVESDRSGRKVDRLVLSAPTGYGMIPRRKHIRKRVADQQFIRVKLWVDDPYTSDIAFEDATPHIGVNSFMTDSPAHSVNAVLNISNGGLGLSVHNQLIPDTCAVGTPVAINLFMFSFREKTFKPYWYSGEIRAMHEGRPSFTRMGIAFNGTGRMLGNAGTIHWSKY